MAKPPQILYIHVCDDVRQEVGDKVSLMGLFDGVFSRDFPVVHPRLAVVVGWGRGQGDFTSGVKLLGPDTQVIMNLGEAKFHLRDETQTHRHIAMVFNWRIEMPGTYGFEISLDGKRAGLAPLTVSKVTVQ